MPEHLTQRSLESYSRRNRIKVDLSHYFKITDWQRWCDAM